MESAIATGTATIHGIIHYLFCFADGISCYIHRLAHGIFHILRFYLPEHPVKLGGVKLFFPFSFWGLP